MLRPSRIPQNLWSCISTITSSLLNTKSPFSKIETGIYSDILQTMVHMPDIMIKGEEKADENTQEEVGFERDSGRPAQLLARFQASLCQHRR